MDTAGSSFQNYGRGSLSEDKMYFLPTLGEKGSFLLLLVTAYADIDNRSPTKVCFLES